MPEENIDNNENIDNTEIENQNNDTEITDDNTNASEKEKPNLFDGVNPEDSEEDTESEETEDEFDYSKILGEEYDDKDKEKIDNLREKYKDPDDLLKALYNANKMIGSKTGVAPENYEFEKSEDLEIDIHDDIMESFTGLAKENGLSNDQFNNLVNNFAKQTQEIMNKAIETERETIKSEIDSIENFETRASSLLGKAKNLLSEDDFKVLTDNVSSKQHFEVLEKIINSTKNSSIKADIPEATKSEMKTRADELTGKIMKETNNNQRESYLKERRDIYTKLNKYKED